MKLHTAIALTVFRYEFRLILWILVVAGAVILELITLKIIREVNKQLPEEKKWRLGRWWFIWDEFVMLELQHRHSYPQSRLRKISWLITILWFPLFLALLFERL